MDIADFSQKLGSNQPTPGGGAAAGLILSLAAAAAQKAMVFSKPENYDEIQSFLENVRKDGLYLCKEDQKTFLEWQKARKLPKDTEEQKAIRTAEINRRANACTQIPLIVGKASIALIFELENLLPLCSKFLISDISCAASFALASLQAACVNVKINLPYIKDDGLSEDINYLFENKDEAIKKVNKLIEKCNSVLKN